MREGSAKHERLDSNLCQLKCAAIFLPEPKPPADETQINSASDADIPRSHDVSMTGVIPVPTAETLPCAG